jgi:hypothetical protein
MRRFPAVPQVAENPLGLTDQHQEAAEGDDAVHIAHRQVDDGHALHLHALHDQHREVGEQGQEAERNEIDQSQQQPPRTARQQVGQQDDGDVRIAARHHGSADEGDAHQAVAGDLLGPRQAVIENVAGKKLQEDDESQRPEQRKGQPILGVMLDLYFHVLDVDQMLLRLLAGTGRGHRLPQDRRSRAAAVRQQPGRFQRGRETGRQTSPP